LRAIAEWVGAPSASALKTDPRPWLAQVAEFTTQREGDPEPLPSTPGDIEGWQSRLLSQDAPEALEYLTRERGLTVETIAKYHLGWDGDEQTLTLPVYDSAGELVNVRRRRLGPGEPFRGLRGRGSQLYPDLPPDDEDGVARGALLVAGEFDALAARQHGAGYVVTTTCGASLPDHLAAELAGRSVAVAYDVGEDAAAARTVAKLCLFGCASWVVRLELLGLPPGGDLNDYFRNRGTARELANLIRRERAEA
jgi:DNA primase